MASLTISIAMATYNGEMYLREQLDSFSMQIHPPDELVVCDDGSADDTIAILEEFAAKASFPVRIVRNDENLGYGRNFQKAMLLCKGEIIFPSDQDDYWLPEKIATQMRYLEENPSCMVVICDMELCGASLDRTGKTKLQNLVALGYNRQHFVNGCGMAIRRPFLDLAFPMSNGTQAHDSWLSALADTLHVKEVIPRPLQLHRRHGGNTSDGIAARSTRVRVLDRLRIESLNSSRKGWEAELADIRLAVTRLTEAERTGSAQKKLPSEAVSLLDRKASALARRISVTSYPRAMRWPCVVWSWLAGDYRQFNGWKSAAKDLVSP